MKLDETWEQSRYWVGRPGRKGGGGQNKWPLLKPLQAYEEVSIQFHSQDMDRELFRIAKKKFKRYFESFLSSSLDFEFIWI